MKHINIALFVTHEGCPNMCTFCNQRSISGSSKRVTPDDVREAADTALAGKKDVSGGEIAFFGGSFTMIEREYMLSLLDAAKQYIDRGLFAGIRVSTRPDGISDEICAILKEYGVTSVELGAHRINNKVLELNRRGHTAKDVENACALLKKYGFETGLQMMTGLYGSTDEDSVETAKKLIALNPATVRIYPTVVIEGTELCELMKSGKYTPQTVDEASELGSVLIPMFEDNGIKVIRFGLHSGGGVQGAFAGGAYHPALREMAESRIYLRKAIESAGGRQGRAVVYVNPACVSKMTGQKRENIEKLSALGIDCSVKGDASLGKYEIKFELT